MQKQKIFSESEAENFLRKYISVAKSKLCKNKKYLQHFGNFRFPRYVGVAKQQPTSRKIKRFSKEVNLSNKVVMKIISKQALHKTEINGVKIVEREFEKEFDFLVNLAKKKKIKLDGILLQEYLEGIELVIGIKKDETFGHVIMLGAGGILVELIKDVTFRVCPIDKKEAEKMINELKIKKLLYGFRGSSVNLEHLKKTIVSVSKIPIKNPNIKELDINPFIINEKYGKVADARIVFE